MTIKSDKRPLLWAACAAVLQFCAGTAHARAQPTPVTWNNWLTSLQASGYTVTQGSALQFTTSYCVQYTLPYFGYCFASDPEDPYLQPIVPIGNGYVDSYYGPTAAETLSNGVVASDVYHLSNTDAVVAIINLPPKAAYFSYQSYVFTRPVADYPGGVGTLSPDPARASLFATFNNSINNAVIKTQSGLDFGQGSIAVITTPNSTMATALLNSFPAVGGDPKYMFVEQMGNIVHTGLDQTSDDLSSVIRYAIPQDASAGQAWRNNVTLNVKVYRISAPAGQGVALYGSETLRTRNYNADESSHAANVAELSTLLRNYLATLENNPAVKTHNMITSETVSKRGVITGGYAGPFCIANGTNCTADEQDTAAYRSLSVGKLAAGKLFIIDGVDHTVTNNSTLEELSVSNSSTSVGVTSVSQTNVQGAGFTSGSLTGSALTALQTLGLYNQASPALIADLPNLYVQFFTRPCTTQAFCNQPYTTVIDTTAIPYNNPIRTVERAYLLPGYFTGANPDFLTVPQVIF